MNRTTQPTREIRKLNFMTDMGSIRSRLSMALRVCWPGCGGRRVSCGCGGRRTPGGAGRRAGGAFGLGFGLVSPENEAPTLEARPRAPLAAPATAAIAAVWAEPRLPVSGVAVG